MAASRTEHMTQKLHLALVPEVLELEDQSAAHAGHYAGAGDQTHYRLLLVSNVFQGRSLVQRHQMVYRALGQEFDRGLHALSICALTPEEHHGDKASGICA